MKNLGMMVYTCNPSAVEMGAVLANLASCVSSRFREILSQVREGVGAWGCPLTLGWGKEGRRVRCWHLRLPFDLGMGKGWSESGSAQAFIPSGSGHSFQQSGRRCRGSHYSAYDTPPPNSSFTSLTVAPRGSERLGNLPKVTQAESGEGVMWDTGL